MNLDIWEHELEVIAVDHNKSLKCVWSRRITLQDMVWRVHHGPCSITSRQNYYNNKLKKFLKKINYYKNWKMINPKQDKKNGKRVK